MKQRLPHHGPCIQALPAAPARTSEARSWLQDATTAAEQRNIELRTRSHLLSSVDPVPYGDTNEPAHAPAVVSLAPSAAAVPASSLGPWRIVRCIVARFSFIMLYSMPIMVSQLMINPTRIINDDHSLRIKSSLNQPPLAQNHSSIKHALNQHFFAVSDPFVEFFINPDTFESR
jgi:hypothetical protein